MKQKFYFLIALWLLAWGARAQAPTVRITVLLVPPYSTHLADYIDQPNRMLVSVSNLARTPVDLQLAGNLSSDAGIQVYTKPSYRSPRPVTLQGLETRRLSQDELTELFDAGSLNYVGIKAEEIVRGNGLPEGSYTVCVRALDYNTRVPLSADAPGGCSRPVLLRALEAPYIVRPAPDEVIKSIQPQNIIFTWTRPAGAPPTTEYTLRIIEPSSNQRNINDAFLAGTTPPLFETTVQGAPTFLYGPGEPALVQGRRYAFAVTASDPRGQSVFKNGGRSEVQSFVYGEKPVFQSYSNTVPVKPTTTPPPPGLPANPVASLPGSNLPGYNPVFYSNALTARLLAAYPEEPLKTFPLANQTVSLIVSEEITDKGVSQGVSGSLLSFNSDYHRCLATGVTGPDGRVTFHYINDVDYKATGSLSVNIDKNGNKTSQSVPTKQHCLTIRVENGYYTSTDVPMRPAKNVTDFDGGTQTVAVRSVTLDVRLVPEQLSAADAAQKGAAKQDPLLNVPVYVLRKAGAKLTDAPADGDGGSEMKSPLPGFTVVAMHKAEALTKNDTKKQTYATAHFGRLLPTYTAVQYYLYADPKATALGEARDFAYQLPAPQPLSLDYFKPDPDKGSKLSGGNKQNLDLLREDGTTAANTKGEHFFRLTKDWDPLPQATANLPLTPEPPRIVGNSYRADAKSKALGNTQVRLMRWPKNGGQPYQERSTQSAEKDGYFHLDNLSPEVDAQGQSLNPVNRALWLDKDGYDHYATGTLNNGLALAYGQQVDVKKLMLSPSGSVKGKVEGPSQKTPTVTLTVGGGVPQELSSPPTPVYGPRKFDTAAPTGKQLLSVVPNDQNYFRLDTTVNITGPGQDLGTLYIIDKKHRLRVVAYEPTAVVIEVPKDVQNGMPGSLPGGGSGTKATPGVPAAGQGGSKGSNGNDVNKALGQSGQVVEGNLGGNKSLNLPPPSAEPVPGYGTAVAGVKVEVLSVNPATSATTDKKGTARLSFASGATQFTLRLTPPDGYHLRTERNIVSYVSRHDSTLYVAMEASAVVRGQVRVGKAPIAGARVFVDLPGSKIEAWTGADGRYELTNVPLHQYLTLRAVRQQDGKSYVGAELSRSFQQSVSGVDLVITEYGKYDVSRLLGVPIEIEDLTENANGTLSIAGAFVKLAGTAGMSLPDTTLRLPFGWQDVKAGPELNGKGRAYVVLTKGTSVDVVGAAPVELLVNGNAAHRAQLQLGSGLKVQGDAQSKNGSVRGSVYLPTTLFPDQNLTFAAGMTKVFLAHPTAAAPLSYPVLQARNAVPSAAPVPRWRLVTSANKSLKYTLYGFVAEAGPGAVLGHDTLQLPTVLHPQLPGQATPNALSLAVGRVSVLLKENGVLGLTGSTLSIPLEQWALGASSFSLDNTAGLLLKAGTLKTGAAEVPYTNLTVLPASLGQGQYNLTGFKLGSVGTLGLKPGAVAQLGYDAGLGHWSFDVTAGQGKGPAGTLPVATLSGLPHVEGAVDLSVLTLLSNNAQSLNVAADPAPLTAYRVINFRPATVSATATTLSVQGALALGIPQVGDQDGKLIMTRVNGVDQLTVSMPDLSFQTGPLAVKLPAGTLAQLPNDRGIGFEGTVEEAGVVKFDVRLTRSLDSTSIGIQPNQHFDLAKGGTAKLQNVRGWMHPNGPDAWNLLSFWGKVEGAPGMNGNPLGLTVKGDLTADNQKVKVDNVDTPFGALAITFDIPTQCLVGNLKFNHDLGGGSFIEGCASLVVDPTGWFMLSGGHLTKTNPQMKGAAAIIIGDHTLADSILTKFQGFSHYYDHYKKMPVGFPVLGVHGVYCEGRVEMPIPIVPQFDIDLKVFKAKLLATIGGDLRLGLNFAGGTEVSVGQSIFANVGLAMGTTEVIVCGGVGADVSADISADGKVNLATKEWAASGDASLLLEGTAYYGAGLLCDSKCELACKKDEHSYSVGVGAHVQLGSAGTEYKFYFK